MDHNKLPIIELLKGIILCRKLEFRIVQSRLEFYSYPCPCKITRQTDFGGVGMGTSLRGVLQKKFCLVRPKLGTKSGFKDCGVDNPKRDLTC